MRWLLVTLLAAMLLIALWSSRLELVYLDDRYTSGTDGACVAYWKEVYQATADGDIAILINPGWIPSTRRIVNHRFATEMVRYDGQY